VNFYQIFHDFPGKFIFPGFSMIFHDRGNPVQSVFFMRCLRLGWRGVRQTQIWVALKKV